jgi:predicted transcriptional regulator
LYIKLELEPVLAATRWRILKVLAERKASPLEMAQELKTTIANISQQLRLLEAYGLVKKERIQGRERNKPRMLYSIAQDSVYYVTIASKFAEKRKINLTKQKRTILKIWSIEKEDWQYYIEKFYWKIEPNLKKIRKIGVDVSQPNITLIIETDEPKEFERIGKMMNIKVHAAKELKPKEEVKIIFENE